MGNYRVWSKFSLVLAVLAFVPAALAQRTDENVTTQSEDAFGRSVGTEQLGIYSQGEVRGFSPIDAGNTRIEGLSNLILEVSNADTDGYVVVDAIELVEK